MAEPTEQAAEEPPALVREQASRIAKTALLVTVALYGGYALLRQIPKIGDSLGILLIAGFYFLPGLVLRKNPKLAERWQVGPDVPIPKWTRSGWLWAVYAGLAIFPFFVVGTWWFYAEVCTGDLSVLSPVLLIEQHTPAEGGLVKFLTRQCRQHPGGFWPSGLVLPPEWVAYYGLGFVEAVLVGLFITALPEEVFHRGYLMSALELRWPPTRKLFGVPFGMAAVISSVLFALGHLVNEPSTAKLATFFPALAFAWLWRRSGSLWAPALFHLASNLLMTVLLASTLPGK